MESAIVNTSRKHAHEGTILVVAAKAYGVDVTTDDVEYFSACSKLAAVADDIVDTENRVLDISSIIESPVEKLEGHLDTNDQELVLRVINRLSVDRQNAWLQANDMPHHAEQKKSAKGITELCAALIGEAELFTNIFSLDEVGRDSRARRAFNKWLGYFARGGYFVDSAVDMPADYRAGRVSVEPTIGNRMVLGRNAMYELKNALTIPKSPRLLVELGRTATLTLREATREF